jgi:hypothetical protein
MRRLTRRAYEGTHEVGGKPEAISFGYFTRGKGGINRDSLRAFTATLKIPETEKQAQLRLSPGTCAVELAKRI